ncbi:cbb3-type cytochrome c oxidase subunit 3 [Parvibaculum sp.]|jgi:cytochrome c oxidase cbb3-type subunit 4|uniref:cbb3-type cytochrome c oxidase subunit 3 n=1 Tax=Parvibaculum sp. TaxID=2024848 RepID=UPI002A2CEB08|nr:cbb3-type cytochrome c oxidase subunit 3 [Parvibaculum sp.]
MTYDMARTWFGTGGLILMVVLFAIVLVYALRPSNKQKFDHLAALPLKEDGPGEAGKPQHGKKDTESGA